MQIHEHHCKASLNNKPWSQVPRNDYYNRDELKNTYGLIGRRKRVLTQFGSNKGAWASKQITSHSL